MELITHPTVQAKWDSYPNPIRERLQALRSLILETAEQIPGIKKLEEGLKWGEPSYSTKNGSTIRMNQVKNEPDRFALYFTCSTSLVETFKTIYGEVFSYEGTRALHFKLGEDLPEKELKHCISLALNYHKLKNLPLLGA